MDRRTFLAAPLFPLLGACGSIRRKDHVLRLDRSLTAYAGAIRWGNLDTAYAFARPRAAAPQPPRGLSGLKVTGYEIRVNSVNEAGDEANVTTSFTYYFQDHGRVQTVHQSAPWYFDDNEGAWLLDAPGLPRFDN